MAVFDSDSSQVARVIATGAVCFAMILFRCSYQLLRRRHRHTGSYHNWDTDDSWMFFAILPLAGRVTCIAWSFIIETSIGANASVQQTSTVAISNNRQVLALKLLLPGRIFYALFLWCLKFSLLGLYERISMHISAYRTATLILRISFYITFIVVLFPTLLECRPIALFWNGQPEGDQCRKARGNLSTMAALNLTSDLALMVFPLPLLWKVGLDWKRKLPLIFLFGIGSLVIITTLVRLPLILEDNVQSVRTLWADIEILCACIVANASFYFALFRDITQHPHNIGNGSTDAQQTHTSLPKQSTASNRPFNDDEDELRLYDRHSMLIPRATMEPIEKSCIGGQASQGIMDKRRESTEHVEFVKMKDIGA